MDKSVRVCVDRIAGAPPAPYVVSPQTMEGLRGLPPRERIAFVTPKMWEPGRTIRIRFLEGSPKVQNKVKEMAMLWTNYANIKFQFVNDSDADIQIAFKQGDGSWSYIGIDANTIPTGEPTMNFGWFDENTSDEEFSRTTKHEFGHMLGCIHEHQNPADGINWNKEVVYTDLGGSPNFWPRETIDHNMFERYSKTITQYTEVDPKSIMMYRIPARWTTDGKSYGENVFDLSNTDKEFAKKMYP
ncbi:MAG TPA: M12 family metallopeptidase [Nitrososphaeraceae archaeon]|jgi:serralysin|nr:M12 family metallopeptidase [Nitrososphaeraceae archaeon]